MNSHWLLPALLVGAAMSGCGNNLPPGYNYTFYLDPTFPTSQQENLLEGVSRWVDSKAVSITVIMGACGQGPLAPYTICTQAWSRAQLDAMHPKRTPGTTVGATTLYEADQSSLVRLLSPWDLTFPEVENDMHEVGHALMLEHTQAGTVMFKDMGTNSGELTCADLQQYWSIRGQSRKCAEPYVLSGQ
jgi:hypothetical protein